MFYADDLCVIAPNLSDLQALLNICTKFRFENDIQYNPIKSICMVIKPHGFHTKCPDIYMNNNKLVFVEKTKYLGLMICNDLKDDEHMLRHLRSFNSCSIGVKLHLFHCSTIYCSQLWVNFNKGTYLKLKVAYNNMHRRILGYHR